MGEDVGLADGEVGEDFSINLDVGFFEGGDEGGISQTGGMESGVDTQNPGAAQIPAANTAASESILAGVKNCLMGYLVQAMLGHAVPLG